MWPTVTPFIYTASLCEAVLGIQYSSWKGYVPNKYLLNQFFFFFFNFTNEVIETPERIMYLQGDRLE